MELCNDRELQCAAPQVQSSRTPADAPDGQDSAGEISDENLTLDWPLS